MSGSAGYASTIRPCVVTSCARRNHVRVWTLWISVTGNSLAGGADYSFSCWIDRSSGRPARTERARRRAAELHSGSRTGGSVRYTHYSFLVYGYSRIPIVSWLREQASESLLHAQQAGEMITHLGAYPSLTIGPLLDNHQHDIGAIMRESLETEGRALALYKELLTVVEGYFRDAGGVCAADGLCRGAARGRG